MGKSDLPQSRFQSSRLSRLLKVGKSLAVATGHLAAEKVSDFVKDKNDAIHELSEDVKASAARVKAAQEIIQSMGHLKGGLMKIGQMISITEDLVLPKEISSLFKSLQQHAPAMTQNELSRVFRRNFQDLPEKVFKSFDYSPIAAASIGQVHRATLHSGEEVAVKIQYPDIVNAIKSDLQNIDQLDRLFGAIFPSKPHIRPMLEELKNTLIDECNYHKELENLNFFRNAFDREFNGKVKIPKTFEAFSTLEILTTELVKGSSFEETLSWPQQDRDSLGEITYNSFLFSFFSLNALHTDPQNGNYLFNKDQIIIMDFGSVKFFSQEFVRYYTGILISIEKHDMRLFRVCALNLRMIRENDSAEYIQKQFDLIDRKSVV